MVILQSPRNDWLMGYEQVARSHLFGCTLHVGFTAYTKSSTPYHAVLFSETIFVTFTLALGNQPSNLVCVR